MPVPFRSYDRGSHLLHPVVNLSPESSVERSEAIGLSCSNKNRQFTVIWLWFNNAFKRGSKWLIKSGDLFTLVCFIRPSLWAGALHTPRPPRGRTGMNRLPVQGAQFPQSKWRPATFFIPLAVFLSLSFLPFFSPTPLLFSFLFFSPWTMKVEWQCKSQSLLKNPGQGGSVSPIFMSFKWLLSKWGRTKSRPSCHKYKWVDIGCNKPSGKIIWCAVAVMVYHTGSSYISTGKVIRSSRGL